MSILKHSKLSELIGAVVYASKERRNRPDKARRCENVVERFLFVRTAVCDNVSIPSADSVCSNARKYTVVQDNGLNALAGVVSLCPMVTGDLFKVKGGNARLSEVRRDLMLCRSRSVEAAKQYVFFMHEAISARRGSVYIHNKSCGTLICSAM